MRSSDWSSVVCSSDLDRRIGVVRVAIVAAADERLVNLFAQRAVGRVLQHRLRRRARVLDRPLAGLAIGFGGRRERGDEAGPAPREPARTRVVAGKSGSVRVDPGGGPCLTKKKQ